MIFKKVKPKIRREITICKKCRYCKYDRLMPIFSMCKKFTRQSPITGVTELSFCDLNNYGDCEGFEAI